MILINAILNLKKQIWDYILHAWFGIISRVCMWGWGVWGKWEEHRICSFPSTSRLIIPTQQTLQLVDSNRQHFLGWMMGSRVLTNTNQRALLRPIMIHSSIPKTWCLHVATLFKVNKASKLQVSLFEQFLTVNYFVYHDEFVSCLKLYNHRINKQLVVFLFIDYYKNLD